MFIIGSKKLPGDIAKAIRREFKEGHSKQNIYADFKDRVDETQLRLFLASFPDSRFLSLLRPLNIFVAVIWTLLLLIELLGMLESAGIVDIIRLLITAYVTREIFRFNGSIYLPGIFLLLLFLMVLLFDTSRMTSAEWQEEGVEMTIYFAFAMLVMTIITMVFIRTSAFRHYKWFKPMTNSDGQFIFESIQTSDK